MKDTMKEHARLLRLANDHYRDALCCLRLAIQDEVREKYVSNVRDDVERAQAVVDFLKANAPEGSCEPSLTDAELAALEKADPQAFQEFNNKQENPFSNL
jgi:hypothetical protein